MNLLEIFLISLSVAIDAFAVSIVKGMELNAKLKNSIVVGLCFGSFQTIMPSIGFFLGNNLEKYVFRFGYIISFILLIYIGLSMMLKKEEKIENNIFILGLATSIDAFSIGVAYIYGYGNYHHIETFMCMGVITFVLSIIGFIVGNRFKYKFNSKINVIGGIILIFLGFKLLLEHFY